jgi:hypothetical protein
VEIDDTVHKPLEYPAPHFLSQFATSKDSKERFASLDREQGYANSQLYDPTLPFIFGNSTTP